MRLLIDNGALFADGLFLCYARNSNARSGLDDGCFAVEIRKDARGPYVFVDGIGRVGADGGECDIVLGSVLGASGVIPCPALVERLLAIVQSAKGAVLMEINNG